MAPWRAFAFAVIIPAAVDIVASPARAESTVTVLGVSAYAECAAYAAAARRTGIGTHAGIEACDRALETLPADSSDLAIAYVNRSVIRITLADHAAAMADDDAAIHLNPMLATAYFDRAIAESAMHLAARSEGDFTRAIGLDVAHPEQAYFYRALVREDAGDLQGAYADYRRASALNPAWVPPRVELARFKTVNRPDN